MNFDELKLTGTPEIVTTLFDFEKTWIIINNVTTIVVLIAG